MIQRVRQPLELVSRLAAPLVQVASNHRLALRWRNLSRAKPSLLALYLQRAFASNPQIARPAGLTPRRDQVVHTVDLEDVDRRADRLARLPSAEGEHWKPAGSPEDRVHDVR